MKAQEIRNLKLSQAKGGNYAINLTGQRTKDIFLAVRGTKIFLPTHV